MGKLKNSIYRTATFVAALSCAEKLLGFLYRILFSRTVGSEGMGLYQIAFSIFAVLVTATASGIPISVSRQITKSGALGGDGSGTVAAGIFLSLTVTLPVLAVILIARDKLGFLFSDERCLDIFIIMAPAVVFSAVYAVIRGALWGKKLFFSYSLAELIEECAMIAVGSILVINAADMLDGAKRAAVAITASAMIALAASAIFFICGGGKLSSPKGKLKPLISSSAPVTAMRAASSTINSAIAVLLPARLIAAGLTEAEAMSEYGMIMGMVLPVLSAPSTAIGSLALVLAPTLSESFYKKNYAALKRNIESALKLTSVIACALIPFLLVLGEDAGEILFSDGECGRIISRCAVIVLPLSLNMISSSALNSMGRERRTLINFLISSAFMLAAVIFLPRFIGIYAVAAGTLISLAVSAALNLIYINKVCPEKPKYLKNLIKAFGGAIPAAVTGKVVYSLANKLLSVFPSIIITAFAIAAAVISVYLVLGLITLKPIIKKFDKKSVEVLTEREKSFKI